MKYYEDKKFNDENINLGEGNIDTVDLKDSVYVSDPCYNTDVWCLAKINNVLPGKYNSYITVIDKKDWGLRVSQILVIHKDYIINDNSIDKLIYEHLSEYTIGVDSGQCGIFDSEYYEKTRNNEDWYSMVCDITLDHLGGTIDNLGVVSSSGYGDGSYPLYVSKNDDGKIISLKVIFISDNNEELYEDKI